MTLTVTGTLLLQAGCLMCTDSTTITGTVIFQAQAQSHFFPAGLVPWAYLTCLLKIVVSAVLHEMLRFRAIFLNENSIAIHCRRLFNEGQLNTLTCILVQQTSWLCYKFEVTTFTARHILDNGSMDFPLHQISLVPRPHPAHARRRDLVSQVQIRYRKAGNGNETETGNGNWKLKLETEMGTKDAPITGAIFSS